MESTVMETAISQGIWAVLAVFLPALHPFVHWILQCKSKEKLPGRKGKKLPDSD